MKTTARRWGWQIIVFSVVVIVVVYIDWALLRPLPQLVPKPAFGQLQQKAPPSTLGWPSSGQSAVGIVGSDILETHGTQSPVPIASTAKIITALVVLGIKPLELSQQGPTITLTSNDVALYDAYAAQHGSVVPVQVGEQISQYQILQAILLPSANNMADSLAIWGFGSLDAYSVAANSYLKEHGLSETKVGNDASGLSPTTTSTAHDLVRLGELAMQNPVLAQIVDQTTVANIPLTNGIKNVNFLLGTDNIIGIKTGNTDEAGGVFISASRVTVNDKPVTIVTALTGAPTLFAALKYSLPLIQTAGTNFSTVTLIKAGTVVGTYRQPWGGTIAAVASQDLATTAWNGETGFASTNLLPVTTPAKINQSVGTANTLETPFKSSQNISLTLRQHPTKPTTWWRLLHPL